MTTTDDQLAAYAALIATDVDPEAFTAQLLAAIPYGHHVGDPDCPCPLCKTDRPGQERWI